MNNSMFFQELNSGEVNGVSIIEITSIPHENIISGGGGGPLQISLKLDEKIYSACCLKSISCIKTGFQKEHRVKYH